MLIICFRFLLKCYEQASRRLLQGFEGNTKQQLCLDFMEESKRNVLLLYRNSYSGMQVNDTRNSIEDKLIDCLFMLGKIEPWNVIKSSKFDWERCSSEMHN